MSRRPLHLVLSAVGWLGFLVVMAWTVVFLADVVVDRTVDGPARIGSPGAVAVDAAVLLLFAVQHSVMARQPVKAVLRERIPPPLERTTYVLATDACLVLLLVFWEPWGGQIWHVDGPAADALWVLYGCGWALATASMFAVDYYALVGLRQAGWLAPSDSDDDGLKVGGLHAVVRHPLMSGLLLAFWATPHMGASHLFFALVMTGYVAIGVVFEERDLHRTFGTAYEDYAARVPAIVPGLRRRTAAASDR